MRFLLLTIPLMLCLPSLHAQTGERPDAAVHKAAMEKLRFLTGHWEGEATATLAGGHEVVMRQSEQVEYRLDGTILVIEGKGRDQSGKVAFNAFAVISFEPGNSKYKIRAWNAGHFVETELKLSGTQFDWSFQQGPVTMINRMHIDEQGRWSETGEATIGDGRKLHSVKMLLSRKP